MGHESKTEAPGQRLLTLDEVLERRKISRAKLYRDIASGDFCAPIKDGARSFFLEREVNAWIDAKAAARPTRQATEPSASALVMAGAA